MSNYEDVLHRSSRAVAAAEQSRLDPPEPEWTCEKCSESISEDRANESDEATGLHLCSYCQERWEEDD